MALVTVAEVKASLGIPSSVTTWDDEIGDLIDGVDGVMLGDVGGGLTAWTSTSYSQKYDVQRSDATSVLLTRWPVLGVTELRTGTNGGVAGDAVASTDYAWDPEGLVQLQGLGACLPYGQQNVSATWTAGFVAGSRDYLALTLAQRLTVVELYRQVRGTGMKSEKIGNYAYVRESREERGDDFYPAIAARIMARFRSVLPRDHVARR